MEPKSGTLDVTRAISIMAGLTKLRQPVDQIIQMTTHWYEAGFMPCRPDGAPRSPPAGGVRRWPRATPGLRYSGGFPRPQASDYLAVFRQRRGRMTFVRERPIHPDGQQRPALQQLLQHQVPRAHRNLTVQAASASTKAFRSCKFSSIAVSSVRMRAREASVTRDAANAPPGLRVPAEFDEFARPRLAQHQSTAEGVEQ